MQRQCSCVAEACDDGLQRITVCLRCDPALRVARRQLSLFITGGHCDRLRWSFRLPPLLLLRSLTQTKAVISIPFFGRSIIILVHRRVAFYGLFVLFRAAFSPLSSAGVDRDHVKKEERYEQSNDDQTAVERKANRKQPPQIDKQTVVLQRQPVRPFGETAPCKGERHQTAKRLWYSELYHFKTFALKWYASP